MTNFIWEQVPTGMRVVDLASLADRRGAARLRELANLLGEAAALAAARRAGPYLLDDELVRELRLAGVDLPASGELAALSPQRWPMYVADLPAEVEVRALVLSPGSSRRLRTFLGGFTPQSPTELLAIAERFFFNESLKVAVAYTAPRGNQA